MKEMVVKILCKQLQLLAEESERAKSDVQALCELTKVMIPLALHLSALLEPDDPQAPFVEDRWLWQK